MEKQEKKYFELFNRLTDVIEELKKIQIEAEEMYINFGELKPILHSEK